MEKKIKSIAAVLLGLTVLLGGTGVCAAETTPVTTEAFNAVSEQPLTIADGITTVVTLDNVSINATGTSAITIGENADVTLMLVGESTLAGDATVESCGVFVPESAKLTIAGDGILNITGGKYGAAIGSYYEKVNGDITINSGTINATGGQRGAGIGSGYHTSAGNITINGGNITAIGTECGAGIGTGYGTSGGGEGKVGTYNGGNITINGGTVKAAPFKMDFDAVDPYDPTCLVVYDNNSFAAGIGGGYGAGSGNISITGGDIIALGSCGGAGIGAGRGTSKAKNYDESAFFVNISISGDAKVVAMATDDVRNYKGGGAAIGAGRGTHTGGTISITDSANVTAIASPFSAAIGAASNPNPVDNSTPTTEKITIADSVTLYAVSDGTRFAIDTALGEKTFTDITENIQQIYFDAAVLSADSATSFDMVINGNKEKTIVVPAKMHSVAVNAAQAGTYYLKSGVLYGVQKDESFTYVVANGLAEQTCIKLAAMPEHSTATENFEHVNEYAYIYGLDDTVLGPEIAIKRGEACAVLYRLLKQSNHLDDFVYDKNVSSPFADLDGRWDRSAIEFLTYKGAYNSSETLVFPDSNITRQEAFKLFCLAMNYSDKTDLPYEVYAQILVDKGFVEGDETGALHLDSFITRAEYCKVYNEITDRASLALADKDGNTITAETYGFTDIVPSDWYYGVMLRATSAYTGGKVDIEKRAIRNIIDDYEE